MREKKQSLDDILDGFGPSQSESKDYAIMTFRVPRKTKLSYDEAQAKSNRALSKLMVAALIEFVERAAEKLGKAS